MGKGNRNRGQRLRAHETHRQDQALADVRVQARQNPDAPYTMFVYADPGTRCGGCEHVVDTMAAETGATHLDTVIAPNEQGEAVTYRRDEPAVYVAHLMRGDESEALPVCMAHLDELKRELTAALKETGRTINTSFVQIRDDAR